MDDEEQQRWRERFRQHWQQGVGFNKACEMEVLRWDTGGVEMRLPFREDLSAHPGVFHGGVISALIDTAGCGAVAAGHDYSKGNRMTTVSLAVQYFSVDPGQGAIAEARCTRRGKQINYADVVVRSDTGKELAHGLVTISVAGARALEDAAS